MDESQPKPREQPKLPLTVNSHHVRIAEMLRKRRTCSPSVRDVFTVIDSNRSAADPRQPSVQSGGRMKTKFARLLLAIDFGA